jgi:hypothetical protein
VALDLETQQPVANTVVALFEVKILGGRGLAPSVSPASTTTDADGRFTLDVTLPSDYYAARFQLTGPGYEESYAQSRLLPGDEVVIRGTPTLTIRRGESVQLTVATDGVSCGPRGAWCRRVIVDSAGSGDVTLELTDFDPEWANGLVRFQHEPVNLRDYTTVLSVPSGPAWVIGVGKVRLTAR